MKRLKVVDFCSFQKVGTDSTLLFMHMVLDLLFEEVNDGFLGVMSIVQQKSRLLYGLYLTAFLLFPHTKDMLIYLLPCCHNAVVIGFVRI